MTDHEAIVFLVDDDEAVRDSLGLLMKSVSLKSRSYASAVEFLGEHPVEEAAPVASGHAEGAAVGPVEEARPAADRRVLRLHGAEGGRHLARDQTLFIRRAVGDVFHRRPGHAVAGGRPGTARAGVGVSLHPGLGRDLEVRARRERFVSFA